MYKNGYLEGFLGFWALGGPLGSFLCIKMVTWRGVWASGRLGDFWGRFGAVSLYKNGHLEWFLGLWALGVHLVLFLLIKMVTWRGFWASGREQLIGFVILLG